MSIKIGENIQALRKEKHLTQEELAEVFGVTSQSISKWELGETSPDIKQAKELSKIFKVSLDELVGNDVNDIFIEKVSNTEKLAGLTLRVLRYLGIILVCLFAIDVIAFIIFFISRML